MSFANKVKVLALGAALVVSGAAFAAGETPSASLSPATQADWDNAHRDVASFNTDAAKERAAAHQIAKNGSKAQAGKTQAPAQDAQDGHTGTN